MNDKTNEKLIKELLDIQQKFEALKSSHEITINELKRAKEWSETLLSSLPHPAMYIRVKDRIVIAANEVAKNMGVKTGGYCWQEFMKSEYISQENKEIAAKYPGIVPSELGIKCNFCLSDKCFSDSPEQIDNEMYAFGLIWETYWIKVSEEVYLHYAINITESKKAKAELILKNLIFESSIAANSISDSEGIITHCNSAFLNIWGYESRDEVIGKPIPLFIKNEDDALKIITALNESGIWEGEYEGLKKDSTTFNAYGLATIVKNKKEENIGYFSAVLDITRRKLAELALKENERKLHQLNLDKDRFISILAHDLKNPLNNILGLSELITAEIKNLNSDEIEEFARNINISAEITNKLLEDLLMWARTQQDSIPLKPQKKSFAGICKDAVEVLRPNATAKNITINYNANDQLNVFADVDMLESVLRNLVSNSIKFTNHGGVIQLYAEENSGNVTISVSDNGVGIPPDNLAKLFDLSKVITTKGTAKETGTGLGLLICKELVEKHGGKIWVESVAGKGSDFKFTIPVPAEQSV
jgi:PAS domain S-box-containing protein